MTTNLLARTGLIEIQGHVPLRIGRKNDRSDSADGPVRRRRISSDGMQKRPAHLARRAGLLLKLLMANYV